MKISLTDAGKRFNRDWIFRHLDYEFSAGQSYAIVGPNGSGKSTLLQVLSGAMQVNEGSIQFSVNSQQSTIDSPIASEKIYNYISICAPYLEIVEEMTLIEFLNFHSGFKPFLNSITSEKIISILSLENAVNKQIRNYSSGMRQRVKLAQAIFSDVPVVLLDEPCTNLDSVGIQLYHNLINEYCKNRMVVVSSNDEVEYRFCKERILMSDYK
ncbi:MAG TPA: ATP-binding cassette domain-containing protein [Chitinophagaceae bacterium]|nr:ATP-binding cassette domain-containing protein [Chitinophagaceae bacterium]